MAQRPKLGNQEIFEALGGNPSDWEVIYTKSKKGKSLYESLTGKTAPKNNILYYNKQTGELVTRRQALNAATQAKTGQTKYSQLYPKPSKLQPNYVREFNPKWYIMEFPLDVSSRDAMVQSAIQLLKDIPVKIDCIRYKFKYFFMEYYEDESQKGSWVMSPSETLTGIPKPNQLKGYVNREIARLQDESSGKSELVQANLIVLVRKDCGNVKTFINRLERGNRKGKAK